MKCGVGPDDLIGLSFRGEKTVTVRRSLLCQVEWSMLAAMFNGRHDDCLKYDKDGNVFFDYPPSVMMPLIDQMTVCRDLPPHTWQPKIVIPEGYETMWDGAVNFFGLQPLVQPSQMMFKGIMANLKISDLKGWSLALCKPFSEAATAVDFQLPGVVPETEALIGVRRAGKNVLMAAAISCFDILTSKNMVNKYHNGVYWNAFPDCIFLSHNPFAGSRTLSGTSAFREAMFGAVYVFPTTRTSDPAYPECGVLERIVMVPENSMKSCFRRGVSAKIQRRKRKEPSS